MRAHRSGRGGSPAQDPASRGATLPTSRGATLPTSRDRSAIGEMIDLIDRQIQAGFPLLRFEAALEQRFISDKFAQHQRSLIRIAVGAAVLYDLFLLNDWQMLPDVFMQAVIGRLAIFTPLALITILVSIRTTSIRVLDSTNCAMSVASLTITLAVVAQSTSPTRLVCVYGTLLVMMFCSIVHRLRFSYAVAAIGGMLLAFSVAMVRIGMFDGKMLDAGLTLFVPAAGLLVPASYLLEREERIGYLVALRSRLLNQQLELSGSLDPLTDLWNRRVLSAVMDTAWAAASAPSAMAIIIADIDRFKLFNDSYGHLAGDACLKRVANALRAALPDDQEVLVRFGGEEFVVFVPGLDDAAAAGLAERLRLSIRSEAIPHPVLGAGAVVTASFGVAVALAPAVTAAVLIEAADQALYDAKSSGRDCVRAAQERHQPTLSDPPTHPLMPDLGSAAGGSGYEEPQNGANNYHHRLISDRLTTTVNHH